MRRILALVIPFFLYTQADSALAHGGSHPTPWPEPAPPPVDSPTPTPRPTPPTPTPTPTPEPDPEDPEPTPTPTPDNPPDDPQPTPDPRRDPNSSVHKQGSDISSWQRWWAIHRWKYARADQAVAVTTPSWEGDSENEFKAFLKEALGHKYYDIRSASALALGKAREKGITPDLVRLLDDAMPAVQESALLALGMTGNKDGLPVLRKIVENASSSNRLKIHAALALGLIADPSLSDVLLQVARNYRQNDEVRASAFLALGLMKDEEAALEMVRILSSRSVKDDLLGAVATALAKSGIRELRVKNKTIDVVHVLFTALETYKKETSLRRSVALAIPELIPLEGKTASKAVQRLIRCIAVEKDDTTRGFLFLGLGELARTASDRPFALRVLRDALNRERKRDVQAFVALAAGLSGDRESIQILRGLFRKKGSGTEVRSASALALGLLEDVGSTRELVAEVEGRGDPTIKGYCCMALGLMGEKKNAEALPILKKVLVDGKVPTVRAAAAMALARLGARDALRVLLKAIREENHYFRLSAIMAVGFFRDTQAVKPLVELFRSDDVNDETRAIILVALGYIVDGSKIPALKRIGSHYNFLQLRFEALYQITRLL